MSFFQAELDSISHFPLSLYPTNKKFPSVDGLTTTPNLLAPPSKVNSVSTSPSASIGAF